MHIATFIRTSVFALLLLPLLAQAEGIIYNANGDDADDRFGYSVSAAGDVNNDGFDDVIVGAPFDDNLGGGVNENSGSARIVSGANGAILYTFNGDSAGDQFGISVSGAGDVNNDGYADVIVGALYDDNNAKTDSGSARVLSGATGAILYTFNGDSAAQNFGRTVSGAGDVNKDGFADLIVGSGSFARIYSGANGAQLRNWALTAWAVSDAGDVNKDTYPDVIVGYGSGANSARVYSGLNGAVLYTFSGDSAGDYFGFSVSGAGDVNADGYADVIVGAYVDDNTGTDSGSARVLSGANGAILYTFNGDSAYDYFGRSVSDAGDVNADGYADVIVGAFGVENSGSARIFSGANGAILYAFNGDSASDWFGYSVSGAGDVNADGYADVIVGAYYDDNNGTSSGSARVLSGKALWVDSDGDGQNDAVDADDDSDGVLDINDGYALDPTRAGDDDRDGVDVLVDNCPTDVNADQLNTDGDAQGNVCDADDDGDGVLDATDAFPLNAAETVDTDGDGIGNNADADDDNDGVGDSSDPFPVRLPVTRVSQTSGYSCTSKTFSCEVSQSNSVTCEEYQNGKFCNPGWTHFTYTPQQVHMSIADIWFGSAPGNDVCVMTLDGHVSCWDVQDDTSPPGGFGIPYIFIPIDEDGIADASDNCPAITNADQADVDGDGAGDVCDATPNGPDTDGDTVADVFDNCPVVSNQNQLNTDGDTQGNACDADDDGDGTPDVIDLDPLNAFVNETDMPLNGGYKGSTIKDSAAPL